MKQLLDRILELMLQHEMASDIKELISRLSQSIITEHEGINTKLNLTTKLSISRKLKIALLYGKLDLLQTYKTQLDLVQQLNGKLAKYREDAIKLKKVTNDKIKQLFSTKLSNLNSREYNKYKVLSSQFDFENLDEQSYDRNKRNYDLLELAETFGNDSISKMVNLPKSSSKENLNLSGKR